MVSMYVVLACSKKQNLNISSNNTLSWTEAEPVFLNIYGAQESIPMNEFRQPM